MTNFYTTFLLAFTAKLQGSISPNIVPLNLIRVK